MPAKEHLKVRKRKDKNKRIQRCTKLVILHLCMHVVQILTAVTTVKSEMAIVYEDIIQFTKNKEPLLQY